MKVHKKKRYPDKRLWRPTSCGLAEYEVETTVLWRRVTCKNCLKSKPVRR